MYWRFEGDYGTTNGLPGFAEQRLVWLLLSSDGIDIFGSYGHTRCRISFWMPQGRGAEGEGHRKTGVEIHGLVDVSRRGSHRVVQ